MLACGRLAIYSRTYRTAAVLASYKSVYNLENLHPTSPYNYGGIPQEFSDSPPEKFSGEVPFEKLTIKYTRASGPGGQHVNKTSTKAEVRFNVKSADWIPEDLKPKILEKYKKRISGGGDLIVTADESRYQMRNLKLCLDKIRDFIDEVQKPPDPKKEEMMDRLQDMNKIHAAHRKRLQRKKVRAYTKAMRRGDMD